MWKRFKCSGNGPAPRGGHSASHIEFNNASKFNSVVIFGGCDRTGTHYNDVFYLDLAHKKWISPAIPSAQRPPARSGHSSVGYKQYLYIYGGQHVQQLTQDQQDASIFQDVWQLNCETNTWTKVATTGTQPPPRNAHTANVIEHKMYIFGGSDADGPTNDVFALDLESFMWEKLDPLTSSPKITPSLTKQASSSSSSSSANTSSSSSPASAASSMSALSLSDSSSSAPPNASSFVEVSFDVPAEEVSVESPTSSSSSSSSSAKGSHVSKHVTQDLDEIPSIPYGREMHSCIVVDKSLYIFGGRTAESICDEFYEFNTSKRRWYLHDKCLPLCGHASVCFDSRVILFGGTDCQGLFDTVHVFNHELLLWTEAEVEGANPKPRMAHTLTRISDSEAILFGGVGFENDFNDVFMLLDGEALSHGAVQSLEKAAQAARKK